MRQKKPENDADGRDANQPLPGIEEASADALETRLVEAEKQRDEHLASWQRAQADYQNLRRRLQSDIDAAVQRAKAPLLSELLLVLDYLDMALAAPVTTPEGKNLHAGVQMTKSQLARAVEREGVRPVPESGPFDPSVHDAVERIETRDVPDGEIVETVRRGYMQGTQVLRPAQVKVAVAPDSKSAGER
jgi:molecular chaperone GrpE